MKIIIGSIAIFLIVGLVVWLNNRTAQEEISGDNQAAPDSAVELTSPEIGTYRIEPEQSNIKWTAEKPAIIGYTHHGTFALKEGELTFGENTASGTMVLDMTRLKVDSLGGGKAGNESRLESHLKSGDFFEVETYPTATLQITNVEQVQEGEHEVRGDLTIKDTTAGVEFPATIVSADGSVQLSAEFEIDRTRWGIQFGSDSFFDNLAENAISDMVKIELDIVAQ